MTLKKLQAQYKRRRQIRKLRKVLARPICFVFGHNKYEDNSWSGGYEKCTRCDYCLPIWKGQSVKDKYPYTLRTEWFQETNEYAATCDQFPHLLFLHEDREQAFIGIEKLVIDDEIKSGKLPIT